MAERFPSNWKRCATCVFWTGPREVDYWGNWVSIDSLRTRGRCMCRSGSFRIERERGYSCTGYLKWPALQ